jgi:acetyl-CoA carboxylase carboxyl transferase subunit beta
MVDTVVHRHKLRATVARLCRLMMKLPPPNYPHGNGAWRAESGAGGNGAEGGLAEEPALSPENAEQAPAAPSS